MMFIFLFFMNKVFFIFFIKKFKFKIIFTHTVKIIKI